MSNKVYSPPLVADRGANRRIKIGTAIVAWVAILVNGLLLGVGAADRSWGAFGIAIVIGPITNGVMLLVSAACVFFVKTGATEGWIATYLATCVALPLAAIPLDYYAIGSMGLHGC
jgi:hypothetical protein